MNLATSPMPGDEPVTFEDFALVVTGTTTNLGAITGQGVQLYTFANRDARDAAAVALAPCEQVVELRIGSKKPSGAAMVTSWDRRRDSILQLRGMIAEHRRMLDGLPR